MKALSQLFPRQLLLAYGCLDRIVIRGYHPALQRPENIVNFFHQIVGVPVIDADVLASRTVAYRAAVDRYIERHHIQRFEAPKGERKEQVIVPYYQLLGDREGVACVMTSMEQGTTFISYEPRFKDNIKDENYRIIKRCRKRFQHLYWYIFDQVMGPMCMCIGTYFPFSVQFWLNGHSFVAQQLRAQHIRFRKCDNAILAAADVGALRAAVAALTPQLIQQRCDYWASQLTPRFTLREQRDGHLSGYSYSVAQIEFAFDTIFRRTVPLQALFHRLAELGATMGGADRTMTVFGRHIDRRYNGKLMTVLEAADQGHPVLRSYYLSSYAKLYPKPDEHQLDRCLRAEACINDPRHLGVGRSLSQLPVLVDKMTTITQRYLTLHAELLDTTVDAGHLAKLAQPTHTGKRRIPGLRLHDDRVLRLLEVLLQPAGLIGDWTIATLHARVLERFHLHPEDYQPSQLRYDLWKLRAQALVDRLGNSRRYLVTDAGIRLGTLLVKLRFRLLGPLVTMVSHTRPRHRQPVTAIEAAFQQVNDALTALLKGLALTPT